MIMIMNDLDELIEDNYKTTITKEEVEFQKISEVDRYLLIEDKLYKQLQALQEKLDESIINNDSTMMKATVAGVSTITKSYNEVIRLRQLAEIKEGKLLPISVLDKYKSEFYPRLERGLEEMRASIEGLLASHIRADFINAWNMSYKRYSQACKEAENALNDTKVEAKVKALNLWGTRSNERWQSSEPIREEVRADYEKTLRKYKPKDKTESNSDLRNKL